jgi:riboflavin biosynthesis pyrimidine reductase
VEPLEVLFEASNLPASDLPEDLATLYGGPLGFTRPRIVANFVSSIDGVVALEPLPESSYVISRGSEADRFVMGLLRAGADAILIGAGTMRADPQALWTPEFIAPDHAEAFGEMRRRAGLRENPELLVVTARGKLDPEHPALQAGAVILTTDEGSSTLRDRLPSAADIVPVGSGRELSGHDIWKALLDRGHAMTLAEGGPSLIGTLVEAHALHELFLTLSPVLAGRDGEGRRPSLLQGYTLQPPNLGPTRLLSLRRDGSHLFLRYELSTDAGAR